MKDKIFKCLTALILTLSMGTPVSSQDLPIPEWQEEVKEAFSSAENEVFPRLENVPHPDKSKCPCKGTGTISHGDGHKTECPYHSEDPQPPEEHNCRCVAPGYLCACEDEYDKCSCPPTSFTQTRSVIQMSKLVRIILIATGILLLSLNPSDKKDKKDA